LSAQEWSAEQTIHQRVVDVCLQFDKLGFYTTPVWFESLSLQDLKDIYVLLYRSLITYPSTDADTLRQICPPNGNPFILRVIQVQQRKDFRALQNVLLDVFEKMIHSSSQTQYQSLGAIFVLRVWAKVQEALYVNYPWLADQ
jgi:hypothetical protein